MYYETDNNMCNIPPCQSPKTLLWIWIMLWEGMVVAHKSTTHSSNIGLSCMWTRANGLLLTFYSGRKERKVKGWCWCWGGPPMILVRDGLTKRPMNKRGQSRVGPKPAHRPPSDHMACQLSLSWMDLWSSRPPSQQTKAPPSPFPFPTLGRPRPTNFVFFFFFLRRTHRCSIHEWASERGMWNPPLSISTKGGRGVKRLLLYEWVAFS